ncbi:HEAT repeat domain-containing protein [Halorarius halobius]|uniref:HEAT repeat domain-containing protein n=1 Tax=Halorarius halobius TaxID=2962671 RepID=UPI0020CC387E|nr:HEAT repeat domain-containing protein [Halorarius halobius]
MLFLLKIVIKLIRLFVRAITFPFRLVIRLARGDDGSSEEYDVGEYDVDLDSDSDDSTVDSGVGESADSGGVTVGASSVEGARKHLRRYEYGLYAIGTLMTVGGLFLLGELMSLGSSWLMSTVVPAGMVGILIMAVWAFGAGLAVRRGSTVGYYVGMLYLVFVGLALFLMIPFAVIVGYFGYSGKPVLGEDVSGRFDTDDTAPESTDEPAAGPTADAAAISDAEPGTVSSASSETASDSGPAAGPSPTADAATPGSGPPEPPTSDSSGPPSGGAAATAGDTDPVDAPDGADAEPADASDPTADDAEATPDETPDESGPDERALTEYDERLTAGDATERRAACEDLATAVDAGEVPVDPAVERLVERLETDDDSAVRQAACEALGVAGTADAEQALEAHRLDPDTATSKAASRALRNTPS